jgi:PAS domain S-box-containing protein
MTAQDKLDQSSNLKKQFISNGCYYRFTDVQYQSKSKANLSLIKNMIQGFSESNSSLKSYVASSDWSNRVTASQSNLTNFKTNYHFIYDLFLIDIKGNILFSIEKENDLGTNLITGEYSKTKFSKVFRDTINTHQIQFSGIERYKPSLNKLAGFITSPIYDESNSLIGVFALQLNLKPVFDLITYKELNNSSHTHYIVNQNGILQTPIRDDWQQVLNKKLSNKNLMPTEADHTTISAAYLGPEGKAVFGVHKIINLKNIQWILISEVNELEALSAANSMLSSSSIFVFFIMVIMLVIAIIQVRKITNPINELAIASQKFALGEAGQKVIIQSNNEIGKLANSFNNMILARNEYEKNIQKSNQEVKTALDELSHQQYALDQHSIVAVTDIKGTISYVNERFCHISGYKKEELINNNHRILNSSYHPLSFFKDMYKDIVKGKVWHGEVCNKNKVGELYWVDTTIIPFLNDNGRVFKYIAIRTDITKKKQIEQQNKMLHLNTNIKFNIAQNLAQHSSLKRRIEEALESSFEITILQNHKKAGLYLFEENTLSLCHFNGHFSKERIKEEQISKINKLTNEVIESKNILLIKDSYSDFKEHSDLPEILNHNLLIIPIFNHLSDVLSEPIGGLFFYCDANIEINEYLDLMDEITNLFAAAVMRENARKLLKQATESAEQNSQLKGEFLASMSHEIRTPMNGVLGMLGLLLNTELNDDQLHKASLAKSSAESLLVLINDILDFSKVEAGKMNLEYIDFNLRGMFGEFTESMALRAHEKNLELILDLTEIEYSMVKGDPGRIRQILTNIVGNAIKFTSSGEVRISASMTQVNSEILELKCQVKDTGIGIPKNNLNSLFDIFTQVDASTTRKYGGTGLGLAICKKLCELMNGEISIQSEEGKGSCFTFTVELQKSTQSQKVLPVIDISKLCILIVDDNKTNREVLRGQLEHWGASVHEASGAADALKILNTKTKFDVALLDMQMPDMDGAELGKQIKNNKALSELKLVMMTSISNSDEVDFFAKIGFDAYFPKPATTSDLFNALNVVVDNGEARHSASPIVTHSYLQTLIPTNKNLNIKLLLVEDNKVNQLVAVGILNELGYKADVVNNGQEAIDALKQSHSESPFNLILMDCQMPILDGYKTTQAIRSGDAGQRYTDILIIAMTANVMQGDREKCINCGMNDYLGKPIDPLSLQEKLKLWLNGKNNQKIQMDSIKLTNKEEEILQVPNNVNNESSETLVAWDQDSALKRVLNKEKLLKSLIEIFLTEMPVRLIELKTAVNNQDIESIKSVSHTIKGVAANLSALKLQHFSFELEKAGKSALTNQYEPLYFKLDTSYTEIIQLFQSYISDETTHDKIQPSKAVSTEQYKELLANLIEIKLRIENNDYVEPDEISNFIEWDLSAQLVEKFNLLETQIGQFEILSALTNIDEISNHITQEINIEGANNE